MNLHILPLAVTMMAGPQIIAAIIFVTNKRAARVSFAFLVGVVVATTIGVVAASGLAALLGNVVSLGDSSRGSAANIVQIVLVGLLVAGAVKSYVGRETAEPPKWLGTLQSATPRKALETGLLLILLMPSDIVVMLTVGVNLVHHGSPPGTALAFIAATALVAASPLLAYLLFRRRAERAMPKVRDWMTSHSWLINIIVCFVFIALILSGG